MPTEAERILQIAFRALSVGARPGPHEVLFRGHVEPGERRKQLALDVWHNAEEAVICGEKPTQTIVLDFGNTGPTFDDMLATTALKLWLQGAPPSPGCRRLRTSPRGCADGWRGSSPEVSLDRSLEGLYLESCRIWDADRPPEGAAAKQKGFLAAWQKIEAQVLNAAAQNLDPAAFELDVETFPHEAQNLDEDASLYGYDKDEGERWWVKLPERKGRVAGLFLRTPRSSLFKQWAREDPESGSDEGYGFLAVRHRAGNWVFSTARNLEERLVFLAERLQQAEASLGNRGGDDGWFCGERFQHSLVAAPRGGSRLSEEEVLRIVKEALQITRWGYASGSFITDELLADWPLPQYRNPKLLGVGGQQAPVFQAEKNGTKVALKFFGLESPAYRQRNQRELKMVRRLLELTAGADHRRFLALPEEILHIPRRRRHFDVMVSRYYSRGTLRHWRSRHESLELEQLLRVVETAGQGLALLHACGMVHFDVKPQNILVSEAQEGALTDFGCALYEGSNTAFRDPVFAPPADEIDQKADVVSFAYVVAWLIAPLAELRLQGQCSVKHNVLALAQRNGWVQGVGDTWYELVTDLLLEASQADPNARPELSEFLERLRDIPAR